MTARKVHFDFYADNEAAWCGAVPREGAAPLDLSERRKDVTCTKCLKVLADYDAEVLAAAEAQFVIDEPAMPTQMINNADYNGPTDLSGHTGDLYRSIADRHGVDRDTIENAFNDGFLKR